MAADPERPADSGSDHLNDISAQTRVSIASQLAGAGLIVGGVVVAVDHVALGFALMLAGLMVTVLWSVGFALWALRAQQRLVDRLERGTPAVVEGRVAADIVPARVVRRRRAVVEVSVLAAEGAHRRALLDGTGTAGLVPGATVLVGLHPELREVAVLVRAATPVQVAAAAADPRWRSAQVPRDRDVIGGYPLLAAAGVAGLGAGLTVALIAGALA